jgi:hypothetical protein
VDDGDYVAATAPGMHHVCDCSCAACGLSRLHRGTLPTPASRSCPGEHVPQGMWQGFLICYGQNGQDFIDARRHAASPGGATGEEQLVLTPDSNREGPPMMIPGNGPRGGEGGGGGLLVISRARTHTHLHLRARAHALENTPAHTRARALVNRK